MEVDEGTSSNAAGQPKGGEEKAGGKLHVLGIGGRRAKRGNAKTTGTKKTPGEIRIQKGEPFHSILVLSSNQVVGTLRQSIYQLNFSAADKR